MVGEPPPPPPPPRQAAGLPRQTAYPDGVYVVTDGKIRCLTERTLAECLWSDGQVSAGDLTWAGQIMQAIRSRRPRT